VGLERGPLSLVTTIEKLFERKVAATVWKTEITDVGDPPRWLRDTPVSKQFGTSFADKRRSLGRYSLLAGSGHAVFLFFYQGQ
jgi:hypothetical protein